MGKKQKEWQISLSWAPKALRTVTTAIKLKNAAPWKKSYDKPRHHFAHKGLIHKGLAHKGLTHFAHKGQSYGFSSSHVWMWVLDHKESWAPKNWCFQTVVLEKTLETPLDCKEIKPVNPKGNQPWIFIRRTDAEAPILWPPDVKSWLIEKDPDAGKDWGQEEKGTTEDEMVGWHHWLDGYERKERKKVKSLSCVWLFATPWTVTYQAPPSMGFSRQEYCSGFAFPSPGDLPNPGNPGLPHYKQTLYRLSHQGNYVVNRHDFEQTSGDSKGQGSLACCNA